MATAIALTACASAIKHDRVGNLQRPVATAAAQPSRRLVVSMSSQADQGLTESCREPATRGAGARFRPDEL